MRWMSSLDAAAERMIPFLVVVALGLALMVAVLAAGKLMPDTAPDTPIAAPMEAQPRPAVAVPRESWRID